MQEPDGNRSDDANHRTSKTHPCGKKGFRGQATVDRHRLPGNHASHTSINLPLVQIVNRLSDSCLYLLIIANDYLR
jgi:hypothetical protein